MSLTNFVQLRLQAGITAAATSMTVFAPATPFRLPDSSGTLVLTDSLMQPSKAEIVTYTGLVNNGNGTHSFTGLGRGAEGTTAQVWSAQANVVESVTAGVLASLLADKADIDDARLSDAREWIADTVTQGEGEAGTATTRRAWTAQRVRQAIVAWWNSVSSAWGRGFVSSADAAAGRTALGLGTAATRTALGTTGALYSRDSILGTVSQSAGVPIGAIIERGSNANGAYVRFADGTQICTSALLSAGNVDEALGYVFRTGEIVWTFPVVFAERPTTSGIEFAGVGNCWVTRGDTTPESANSASYRICRAVGVGLAPYAKFMAIGRWY